MAILRAGPFASSIDSFLDEPDPLDDAIVPVNCALVDWIADDWKYLKYLQKNTTTRTYETGLVDESESVSGDDGTRLQVSSRWRYQSSSELSMNVTYNLAASTTGGFPSESFVSISVSVNGSSVFYDDRSDSDGSGGPTSVGLSGSTNITLPACVVPVLVVIQTISDSASTEPGGVGSSEFSIS